MLFLSEITGRFAVGATTFVTPVRAARTVGSAKLRRSNTKASECEPALYLEEVAFTAYYPADASSQLTKKGLDWVIRQVRPVKESLRGFVKFTTLPQWVLWPVIYLFGVFVKIPVYTNAPLLHPTRTKSGGDKQGPEVDQWPLILFSHGLGGSRTAYSQLCSRLAASGKVVLAIEHRDGTGHACVSRSWNVEGKSKPRPILYYKDDDVVWDDAANSMNPTPLPLRTDQLTFRQEELHIAYAAFSRLLQNDPSLELETIENSNLDRQSWSLSDPISGKAPICYTENIGLAGHSFGGCTVLYMLSTRTNPEHEPIPITSALILDPWLEPLPTPGPSPISHGPQSSTESILSSVETATLNSDSETVDHDQRLPRILVINSETFTLWKDHYARLQEVISAWEPHGGRIVTLIGSQHASFSDFLGLPLFRKRGAQILMDLISNLSISFFDRDLERTLQSISTRKMETEIIGKRKDGRPKRKLVGTIGDVIIM